MSLRHPVRVCGKTYSHVYMYVWRDPKQQWGQRVLSHIHKHIGTETHRNKSVHTYIRTWCSREGNSVSSRIHMHTWLSLFTPTYAHGAVVRATGQTFEEKKLFPHIHVHIWICLFTARNPSWYSAGVDPVGFATSLLTSTYQKNHQSLYKGK